MRREELGDLATFLAVADHGSFTRAAAMLGTSQAAVSLAVRRLEERIGLRLLSRTTRRVAPTEAGERLRRVAGPAFQQIDGEMTALSDLRAKPSGTIRLAATENAAETVLLPALTTFLHAYPDIRIDLTVDYGLTDIVAGRFDAGVRVGEMVSKDMVAVRIGPDLRMAVVGGLPYFDRHPKPRDPRDLSGHACINLRLPTHGGLYVWDFETGGRTVNVRVEGQLVFNTTDLIVKAAVAGLGLAYLPESQVASRIADGSLVRVLAAWCPPFPGYHLYYPSRRQHAPAFALLVDALRYRSPAS